MLTFAQKSKTTQQTTFDKPTIPDRSHLGQNFEVRSILHSQHRIAGQTAQRLLPVDTQETEAGLIGSASQRFGQDLHRFPIHSPAAGSIQTKCIINKPGNSYEQEADCLAEQVLRMPEPQLQRIRTCAVGCAGCRQSGEVPEILQTSRIRTSETGQLAASPMVDEVLRSPGRPLDPATRAFMEPRFGQDFSGVRVHTGTAAAQSARDLNAHAYTVGENIVFGAGQFAPQTRVGYRLIAHELVHVVQQTLAGGADGLNDKQLQRDTVTAEQDPWDKLSASGRKQARELYDRCVEKISAIANAQMAHISLLRSAWLRFLSGNVLRRIGNLDDDGKLSGIANVLDDFIIGVDKNVADFDAEWVILEQRYMGEHHWLLSFKSTDMAEAVKLLDEEYGQTKGWLDRGAMTYITDEDYLGLKEMLDQGKHIVVGVLRSSRTRVSELEKMLDVVADLRRHGEKADKYIPGWSARVRDEAAHLELLTRQAHRTLGMDYPAEFSRLRRQLLERDAETQHAHERKKSIGEKAVELVEGGVEGLVGVFVEAAKEAVDLAQIGIHFASGGRYQPRFVSDMADAAKHGAGTKDLLKGMVVGLIETPKRFLKALEDGDWRAIGKETVNLYMLAKTIKEAPETFKKLPDLIAQTRQGLRILRARTIALEINESRLLPTSVAKSAGQDVGVDVSPGSSSAEYPAGSERMSPTKRSGGESGEGNVSAKATHKATSSTASLVEEKIGKLGPMTDETRRMLREPKNRGLLNALDENRLAADMLKLCKSPCLPEFARPTQIRRLNRILKEAQRNEFKINRESIREFLHQQHDVDSLDRAISTVEQQLKSRLPARQPQRATIQFTEEPLPGGGQRIKSEGRVGDAPDTRPGVEKKYPLGKTVGLRGYVRFHVEGIKAIGDELNVVYAPERFNISETAIIENSIRQWRNEIVATGGELYYEITADTHIHSTYEGVTIKVLDRITWQLERRLPGTNRFKLIFKTATRSTGGLDPVARRATGLGDGN